MQLLSPSRRRSVPWLANLATLIALVGTTWWSSEQRPPFLPQDAADRTTVPAEPSVMRVQDTPAQPAQRAGERPLAGQAGLVLAAWRAPATPAQAAAPSLPLPASQRATEAADH